MQSPHIEILHGDCKTVLQSIPENQIDALITDPPAGISFMGKDWDSDKGGRDFWIAWLADIMRECWRVMKPGAHGLVWALPRTSHWTATALEDAGFEIRDVITHLFGSGFPKSLDVSKQIDSSQAQNVRSSATKMASVALEAQEWNGWGTALKPASEHWILIRKPLSESTIAKNVLEYGTGAINIGGCRIGDQTIKTQAKATGSSFTSIGEGQGFNGCAESVQNGRWPANVVLSHNDDCIDSCIDKCAVKMLDQQSGVSKSAGGRIGKKADSNVNVAPSGVFSKGDPGYGDIGGASRFFYVAKPSAKEKNAGCESLPDVLGGSLEGGDDKRSGKPQLHPTKNNHPTVKPITLMQHFATLICPPNGIILDPFLGSGSTLIAAKRLGFHGIGIEREADYVAIAQARLDSIQTPTE